MSVVGTIARTLGPLTRRFHAGTGGNIAIMGALLAPVFVMTTALAVDTARVQTANRNLQQSLDAAALAGAKQYGRNPDPAVVEKATRAFFNANMNDSAGPVELKYNGVTFENGNFVLKVSAVRNEPTIFGPALKAMTGGAWDHDSWAVNAASEVIIENRSVEMALVLDNSGSMEDAPAAGGKQKIDTLRDASLKLVEQLLAPRLDTNIKEPVKISLVPFGSSVNVGTRYRNAAWMDTLGRSPAHHVDLNWQTYNVGLEGARQIADGSWQTERTKTPLTRFTLFDAMANRNRNAAWLGCVDSRPNGLAVTDQEPKTFQPETLFVPYFSPAEKRLENGTYPYNPYTDNSGRYRTELEAIRAQRNVMSYLGYSRAVSTSDWTGPNAGCTTPPITPLTNNKSTLDKELKQMRAQGGTNIGEGLAWGWRTLSPGEPFTQGRAKDADDNIKAIVLMTDGENTYFPGSASNPYEFYNQNRSNYGTFGYGQWFDGAFWRWSRIFDAAPETPRSTSGRAYYQAMNEMTAAVCRNAKADGKVAGMEPDGIVIFTIAFDLPDRSPVKKLLEDCASNGVDGRSEKLYYDARNSNDLLAAFGAITEEISSLRISR